METCCVQGSKICFADFTD